MRRLSTVSLLLHILNLEAEISSILYKVTRFVDGNIDSSIKLKDTNDVAQNPKIQQRHESASRLYKTLSSGKQILCYLMKHI